MKPMLGGKHRKKRHSRRMKRGGAGAPNPSSYSDGPSFALAVNGPTDSQIQRVNNAPGPANNAIIGLQGQRAGSKKRRRSLKGGFWGVINQAAVPLALLGMQQSYGRKRKGTRNRTHRRR